MQKHKETHTSSVLEAFDLCGGTRSLGGAYLLDSVEALTQLTCLHACGLACNMEEDLQALPDSLERLHLEHFVILRGDSDDEDDNDSNAAAAAADEGTQHLGMCHLMRLTQLSLQLDELPDDLRIAERLPTQLLELTASAVSDDSDGSAGPCAVLTLLGGLTRLQQLQRLTLRNCRESKAGLLALNGLTILTEINLRYDQVLADVQTSSAWAQLKQLRSLHVRTARLEQNRAYDGGRGFKQVMEGIEAAISLRKLHLDLRDGSLGNSMRPKLFGYLTGLQQLQELRVKGVHFAGKDGAQLQQWARGVYGGDSERVRRAMQSDAADIQQLTALTGLTRLEVTSWAAGAAAVGAS
ncbi:hypothetical protein OEZ86_012879 [Tetradesmus obliquus]|nr:hypothetical protein OEZ86_012879 [Tetradesmus obliquus]